MTYLDYLLQEAEGSNPLAKVIAPILAQLGFGGVIGFGLGYLLKKIGKIMVAILALVFIAIQILIYYGYIPSIAWTQLGKDVTGAVDSNFLKSFWNIIIHNLPFAAAFTLGFLVGLKKG